MDNKYALLEKLGFSKEYLRILRDDSYDKNFQSLEPLMSFDEQLFTENAFTSLIIEKTELPINESFIFTDV